MKSSSASLVALLTIGIFASSSALAQHNDRDHRPPPPPPPIHHSAPPPPPPAHHVDHRPPPPPPHYVDHRPPPPRVVHIDRRSNWRKGRKLSRKVVYHDVAPERLSYYSLPEAPRGHRYVRVANDILLIAIGTGLIVDAIQDIR